MNILKGEKVKEGWTRKDREKDVCISVRQMNSFILLLTGLSGKNSEEVAI